MFAEERYLLYIDILGFKDLMNSKTGEVKILELHQALRLIQTTYDDFFNLYQFVFFSDTLLVFTKQLPDDQYTFTHLCEVAKNLCFNFADQEVFFRAVLCKGKFSHSYISDQHFFYGESLITAYETEKRLSAHGLFIHNSVDLKTFPFKFEYHVEKYDNDNMFVILCKNICKHDSKVKPTKEEILSFVEDPVDGIGTWQEIKYLKKIKEVASTHSDPRVRAKHLLTYNFYQERFPNIVNIFETNEYDIGKIRTAFEGMAELS
jgi:hypothetical protein